MVGLVVYKAAILVPTPVHHWGSTMTLVRGDFFSPLLVALVECQSN